MKLSTLTNYLESIAPLAYQESYDNSGLLVGDPHMEVTGAIVSLDCTEAIIEEAILRGCNLVISHHPIVFKGLKKLTGKNYIERTVLKAIKNDVALYAIHTNLDNIQDGVNAKICEMLQLTDTKVLRPKSQILKKLVTFCPLAHAESVSRALFEAGAGHIGKYSDCSFQTEGIGTFKAGPDARPFVGSINEQQLEPELRLEMVFPTQLERKILVALMTSHPYEEVAYDIYPIENAHTQVGSGMLGWTDKAYDPEAFLSFVKHRLEAKVIRHTHLWPKKIEKVAVCGGAGSFLLQDAIAAGADIFITADFKYHEFFDAEDKIIIADIGHFETEQFTAHLLVEIIRKKFPNFAIRLTDENTNPINYFI